MNEITTEELKEIIWSKALILTVDIEYAKRYEKANLMGRYEALREIWELLGGEEKDND